MREAEVARDSGEVPTREALNGAATRNMPSAQSSLDFSPELCARLDTYLAGRLEGFGGLREIAPLSGGQSNPTYLVMGAAQRYVMRRKPYGALLSSAHAIDREFRVLKALFGSAVPVPEPLFYCDDLSVIGAEFYMMQFVAGRIFWEATLPDLTRTVRSTIYAEMNRVLASLHALDPGAIGLADYGRSGRYFERQIRRWSDQYRAAATERRDDMEYLIRWLPANVPDDDGKESLVHGDFRLDNMIFDDTGQVLALIDWELSTLGHPYADLAYQCAQWRLPVGLRGMAGVDRALLGIPSEEAYVESYCSRRGLTTIANWPFYLAFSLFRLASICQGVYRRGLDGNASDPAAHEFGERAAVIAAEAVEVLARSGTCE